MLGQTLVVAGAAYCFAEFQPPTWDRRHVLRPASARRATAPLQAVGCIRPHRRERADLSTVHLADAGGAGVAPRSAARRLPRRYGITRWASSYAVRSHRVGVGVPPQRAAVAHRGLLHVSAPP